MRDIYAWLTDRNWKTWVGHFIWGIAAVPIGLWRGFEAGMWLVIGMFWLREISDADVHAREDMVVYTGKGWRRWRAFKGYARAYGASIAEDGYFDFMAGPAGYGFGMLVFGGITGRNVVAALIVMILFSAAFIFGHRVFKKRWPWEGMD